MYTRQLAKPRGKETQTPHVSSTFIKTSNLQIHAKMNPENILKKTNQTVNPSPTPDFNIAHTAKDPAYKL